MTSITELTVRSYECDSYGHVNNAVYLNYLEYGRLDFLRQIGFNYKKLLEAGYYIYTTHVDIHYKQSAFLDDTLYIETSSVKLGAVRGTMHQVIKNSNGDICTIADVTWACVTHDAVPSRIPQEFIVEGLIPEKK